MNQIARPANQIANEILARGISRTLNYFRREIDGPSGIPALAQMILEDIEIPESNELSKIIEESK